MFRKDTLKFTGSAITIPDNAWNRIYSFQCNKRFISYTVLLRRAGFWGKRTSEHKLHSVCLHFRSHYSNGSGSGSIVKYAWLCYAVRIVSAACGQRSEVAVLSNRRCLINIRSLLFAWNRLIIRKYLCPFLQRVHIRKYQRILMKFGSGGLH